MMRVDTHSFVVIKLIISVNLLIRDAREVADVVNDFGRDPIGEGKEEQVCIRGFTLDFTEFLPLKGIQQETRDVAG